MLHCSLAAVAHGLEGLEGLRIGELQKTSFRLAHPVVF